MPAAVTELAKVKREIRSLIEAVNIDLRPGAKSPLSVSDKRALRAEIRECLQALDELSNRLGG